MSATIHKTLSNPNDKRLSHSGRTAFLFIAIFLFGISAMPLFSQENKPKATRQSSMDAFTRGDFEKAYKEFSELLGTFPKDPLYKYYSGVCLVRLNREPDAAVTLLGDAMKGSSVARMVPADALYWHARSLQMAGKYSEAVSEFTEFTNSAGKKTARELNVPDYIQQCNSGQGEIARQPVIVKKEEPAAVLQVPASKPETMIQDNRFSGNLPDDSKLEPKFDSLLTRGVNLQSKADSLYRSADTRKAEMDKLPYREKADLRTKISADETSAERLQKEADRNFTAVQAALNTESTPVTTVKPVQEISKKDTLKETVVQQKAVPVPVKPEPAPKQEQKRDSVVIIQNNFRQALSDFDPDATVQAGDKIETDPVIPQGLIYRIQIAVFKNPVALPYFKGLSPIYGFKVQGADKTNYYAGMFRRSSDAAKALVSVRQKGFRDAFTVALMDGKPVSPDKAAALEKEWGTKPFRISSKTGLQVMAADTVPPTLSFRVEILRSEKPVKNDQLEEMKRVAASRGLDIEKLPDGTCVYLAGKFITYDSAEEYAGLLSRNGFRDAKVTSWLGHKEIPVATARQLFENLE